METRLASNWRYSCLGLWNAGNTGIYHRIWSINALIFFSSIGRA
jgi:hypothetical protein